MTTEIDPNVLNHLHTLAFEAATKDAEKRLEFADSYAHAALKSLFLVNGAAIVSLLTMIGNVEAKYNKNGLFWSFFCFATGLAMALMAYFGAYFCQNFYMVASFKRAWSAKYKLLGLKDDTDSDREEQTGNKVIIFAILTAVLSFCFFVIGAFVALFAIT